MLTKDQICDRLMKEGIDGRSDEDAAVRVILLTQVAAELERKDGTALALTWLEALEPRNLRDEYLIDLDYSRANALAGQRHGTQWQWEQPTLAREIFYLRRAISRPGFAKALDVTKCYCLNNLGNRLRVAGRAIEALDCWRRVLGIQPNFGMSLCNRALILASYSEAIEDIDERVLFLWMAHKEASAAASPQALYTSVHDANTLKTVKKLKEWVESVLDVRGVASENPLARHDAPSTQEESEYRRWCLDNYLFLNPLNDLGPHLIANDDSQGLGSHVRPVDSPDIFSSFYDQMKQEFVSARWLLYEGLIAKVAHFSDKDVLLHVTEPRPSLSLTVEKIKTAYRVSYSLFDKIAFFINAYMNLAIPAGEVSFRKLWRPGKNKPIRNEFDQAGNGGGHKIGHSRRASRQMHHCET